MLKMLVWRKTPLSRRLQASGRVYTAIRDMEQTASFSLSVVLLAPNGVTSTTEGW